MEKLANCSIAADIELIDKITGGNQYYEIYFTSTDKAKYKIIFNHVWDIRCSIEMAYVDRFHKFQRKAERQSDILLVEDSEYAEQFKKQTMGVYPADDLKDYLVCDGVDTVIEVLALKEPVLVKFEEKEAEKNLPDEGKASRMFLRRRIETTLTRGELETRMMLCRKYWPCFRKPRIQDQRFSLDTSISAIQRFARIRIRGSIEDKGDYRVISCCARPTFGVWLAIAIFLLGAVSCIPTWKTSYPVLLCFLAAIGFMVLDAIGQGQACLDRFAEKMTGQ